MSIQGDAYNEFLEKVLIIRTSSTVNFIIPTEILFTNALDLGKVLLNKLYNKYFSL